MDLQGIIACYLLEADLNKCVVVSDVSLISGGTRTLWLILNDSHEEDLETYTQEKPFLREYSPVNIGDAIIWSPTIMQVKGEFTVADANHLLRRFMIIRNSLRPYDGKWASAEGLKHQKEVQEAIVETIIESSRKWVASAADELKAVKTQIRLCETTLKSLHEEAESIRARESSMREMFQSDDKWVEAERKKIANRKLAELRSMYESGTIEGFDISPQAFIATTRPIEIEYPEDTGKMWKMGRYKVTIPWSSSNIAVTQPKELSSKYCKTPGKSNPHPHVSSSGGSCCFGDMSSAIRDAATKAEFGLVMTMVMLFLENYNPASPMPGGRMPSSKINLNGKSFFSPVESHWWDNELYDYLEEREIDIRNWKPGTEVPKEPVNV